MGSGFLDTRSDIEADEGADTAARIDNNVKPSNIASENDQRELPESEDSPDFDAFEITQQTQQTENYTNNDRFFIYS